MEKPRKIMFTVVAVLLYWLAASGFSEDINRRIHADQETETAGFSVFVAEELPSAFGFAVKEGTSLVPAINITAGSVKQSQLYKAAICASEVQVTCAVLQNVSQFYSNPVRIRKSDMLFPFHYFFEPVSA